MQKCRCQNITPISAVEKEKGERFQRLFPRGLTAKYANHAKRDTGKCFPALRPSAFSASLRLSASLSFRVVGVFRGSALVEI
jgi:hypothetical protein